MTGSFRRVRGDAFCRVRDAFCRVRDDAFRRASGDAGGIVLGWLTRLVVIFSLVALALFDAISIASTAMTVADQGSSAAQAASDVWQSSKSVQTTYDAAVAAAAAENSANVVATKDFKVDADGTVHLTVSRTATTLIVFRFGPIKKWAHIERQAEGRSVN
jgi:hypothetical protein